ncbi:venom allergen 5-like [Anticarsia gemmatalis]|uniref:venom allergen 5-like n=1 Tax=Anticarsia gemmatalis TaxID=129554 RepID=UPI003F77052A
MAIAGLFIVITFLIFAPYKSESLECSQIRAFVDGHNSRRLQVAKGRVHGQPAASDMKTMMWDHELYLKASQWASKNKHKHNPDKTVPSGRFKTGENLYWYSTTDANYRLTPDQALESWFSEHANYTYGPLKKSDFDGSKNYQIGHYTQMVWSDSIYVGCAISHTQSRSRWSKFFVVCNYGPTGNYLRETPYARGSPTNTLACGCKDSDSKCNCDVLYGLRC